MVDEKFLTMRSPKITGLSSPSHAMAWSGKDSPNMVSLDQISAESKNGTFQSIYEMQFLDVFSRFDPINHDYN